MNDSSYDEIIKFWKKESEEVRIKLDKEKTIQQRKKEEYEKIRLDAESNISLMLEESEKFRNSFNELIDSRNYRSDIGSDVVILGYSGSGGFGLTKSYCLTLSKNGRIKITSDSSSGEYYLLDMPSESREFFEEILKKLQKPETAVIFFLESFEKEGIFRKNSRKE